MQINNIFVNGACNNITNSSKLYNQIINSGCSTNYLNLLKEAKLGSDSIFLNSNSIKEAIVGNNYSQKLRVDGTKSYTEKAEQKAGTSKTSLSGAIRAIGEKEEEANDNQRHWLENMPKARKLKSLLGALEGIFGGK